MFSVFEMRAKEGFRDKGDADIWNLGCRYIQIYIYIYMNIYIYIYTHI